MGATLNHPPKMPESKSKELLDLPPELLLQTLSNLDPSSITNSRLTCRQVHDVIDRNRSVFYHRKQYIAIYCSGDACPYVSFGPRCRKLRMLSFKDGHCREATDESGGLLVGMHFLDAIRRLSQILPFYDLIIAGIPSLECIQSLLPVIDASFAIRVCCSTQLLRPAEVYQYLFTRHPNVNIFSEGNRNFWKKARTSHGTEPMLRLEGIEETSLTSEVYKIAASEKLEIYSQVAFEQSLDGMNILMGRQDLEIVRIVMTMPLEVRQFRQFIQNLLTMPHAKTFQLELRKPYSLIDFDRMENIEEETIEEVETILYYKLNGRTVKLYNAMNRRIPGAIICETLVDNNNK